MCIASKNEKPSSHNDEESSRAMIREEPSSSILTLELQNGMDVIDSILDDDSTNNNNASSLLTPDQRNGLYELKKTLLSTTTLLSTSTRKNLEDESTSLIKRTTTSHIPQQLFKNNERDDCTSQYLLSEFAGIDPTPSSKLSKWKILKQTMNANGFINGLQQMSSSSNLMDAAAPKEWYELDCDTRMQLAKHLSWKNLMKWDFDIFKISDLCHGKPLLFVGWAILASPHSQRIIQTEETEEEKGYNFLETYNITPKCMIDFLRAIEDGYVHDNPYHNNIHAADVLQTTHSFLEEMNAKNLDSSTKLQLFSLLVGAAIHDVGHPGYNNAFQSNSLSQKALTYNDNSVLENYHISLAFRMIFDPNNNGGDTTNSEINIFQGMDREDFVTCKKLMTEAILGTDLTFHFTKLEEIKNLSADRTNNDNKDVDSYSWKVMKFLMHMADISNLAKKKSISIQWTDRVLSEFFRQGDKEREMGLPISPLCDRTTTSRPQSQMGFISFIIRPSFEALQEHLSSIGTTVLPLVQANYEFWEQKHKEEKEKKNKNMNNKISLSIKEQPNGETTVAADEGGRQVASVKEEDRAKTCKIVVPSAA